MSGEVISRLANQFWLAAGEKEPFPRSLDGPATWALPLAIIKLPSLWLWDVRAWLSKYRFEINLSGDNRHLRACLIAFRGKGFVLLDGTDPSDHQRYSLAHEIAHFLLDYLVPRENAIQRFGDSILEVLDGIRPATYAERLSSALSDTNIKPHVHLMDRREDGYFAGGEIAFSERNADRLAAELLAPAHDVRECVEVFTGSSQYDDLSRVYENVLKSKFGLPKLIANEYARWLCRQNKAEFSFRRWLGV